MAAILRDTPRLDAGFVLLSSLVASGLAFLSQMLVARSLGVAGFGAYTVLFELAATVVALSDSGLAVAFVNLHVRAARTEPGDAAYLLGIALRLKLALTAAALAVVGTSASWLPAASEVAGATMAVLAIGAIAESLYQFGLSVSQAAGRPRRLARDRIVLPALRFAIVTVLYGSALLSLRNALLANAVAAIAAGAWLSMRALATHATPQPPSERRRELRRELRTMMRSTMLASLCVIGITRLQIFLVDMLASPTDVGRFAAAQRYAMVASVVTSALSATLMPRAAAVSSPAEFERYRSEARRLAVAFGFPVVALAVCAGWLLPRLLGPGFEDAVPAARLMLCGYALALLASPASYAFYNLGAASVLARMNLVQLPMMGIATFALVPPLGAFGAACASFIVHVTGVAVVVRVAARLSGGDR